MATKIEPDCPSSPRGDESEGEEVNWPEPEYEEEVDEKPASIVANNVAEILRKLKSTGALVKKPKTENYCFTCEETFTCLEELHNHLLQHVSLPLLILEKLPSDVEDMDDDNWSDEDETPQPQMKTVNENTPTKIDISQILNKTGLSIKKANETQPSTSNTALSKLSGLGFTIKKTNTPIKVEKPDEAIPSTNDVMQKLGQLGGIKLKLKSDGNNTNSFKVINGLKDFKASDDEDEESGNEQNNDEADHDFDDDENDSADELNENRKKSESDNSNNADQDGVVSQNKNVLNTAPDIQKKNTSSDAVKVPARPAVKQTPKREPNTPIPYKVLNQETPTQAREITTSTTTTPERRESQDVNMEKVVVKQEPDSKNGSQTSSNNMPLFSSQIKTERTTPPTTTTTDLVSTPATATVKLEPEPIPASTQPLFTAQAPTTPLIPVTKTEQEEPTIIEINGDSNDEDDDCCVVSATPAPDVKPVVPKVENSQTYPLPPTYGSQSTNNLTSSSIDKPPPPYNWYASDSKSGINSYDKSAEDIFESLLSSSKKDHTSLSEASEYISLDTLGPHHSCDVCNTRFTDISLLEEHKRATGHSNMLMPSLGPSSSTLLPYTPSNNILSSLLPVKQLAEHVGKISGMGNSGPGFTHQQNVMINIQAYPGTGGVMQNQPYNYPAGQNLPPGYPQQGMNNMYGASSQYPGQNFMGHGGHAGYGQQYPTSMPQNAYPPTSTQYSTPSPLQSMQQAVYGQSQMGPPNPPFPTSSPGGSMKSPTVAGSNIKIQNVQTFPPGQMFGPTGQPVSSNSQTGPGNSGPSPGQIRMAAGANVSGPRARMPTVRGARPSIRPGIQVHGQVRGGKLGGPRMPMKRPAAPAGPTIKRRPDVMLPGKHDNEDCHVMSMQKQRDGLPMIQSVQGAKEKLHLGNQISITKKTVNKEANAMANVLASRGISIKQKQKSRSPSPERPIPHIPNLGSGVSIKHTSKTSSFSIPEAKVGGGMLSCKVCKKMFMNQNSLSVHMSNAHPQSKFPVFKCDECPASYPKSLQLQHHKRVFHNVTGPNRELGLPVVDLSQKDNLTRLSKLGIFNFIPLANREQASGCFGIPVVSVHNGISSGLEALGADGLLSLGPLKPLPS